MTRLAFLLLLLAGPARAVEPGIANTPTFPPSPVMGASPGTPPPRVINAIPGNPPPIQVITVPSIQGTPYIAYPPMSFPKAQPTPASRLVRSPQPRRPAQVLVTAEDYPASARARGAQGVVAFVLTVGVDGRVADCTVTRSSGAAPLDFATCRLMRSRARFTPAMDRTGNPAVATIAQQVEWKL